MAEKNITDEQAQVNCGSVNISNDVVSIVASLAASSVKGVSSMVSGVSGGFAELLGKKNMSKGVKVSVADKKVTLDLAIIVEYGTKIPDVAWEIQEKVKSEVEAMTGLSVAAVNVSVEGVNVPQSDNAKSQTVGEKIGDKVGEAVSIAQDIKDGAEDIVSEAKETVQDTAEKAADVIREAVEKVKDVADDAAEDEEDNESEEEPKTAADSE